MRRSKVSSLAYILYTGTLVYFLFLFVQVSNRASEPNDTAFTKAEIVIPQEKQTSGDEKFITTVFKDECGGRSNIMWRMASLTGIGRIIGRIPYFHKNCIFQTPLNDLPEYMRRRRRITKEETKNEAITVDFGLCSERQKCKCGDENPKKLRSVSKKYLMVTGECLQCYQWLEPIYEEILEIFNWSQPVREASRIMAEDVFRSDNNHKLCVHNRRGDFLVDRPNAASKMDFTVAAVKFVFIQVVEIFGPTSVVLLGQDRGFSKNVFAELTSKDNKRFGNIYIPEIPSGSILQDQSFGSLECDSLLITSSSSTYSWWIGYLMRSAKNASVGRIYYNSEFHLWYGYENFPPLWIPIKLTDGVIREDFSGPYNSATLSPEIQSNTIANNATQGPYTSSTIANNATHGDYSNSSVRLIVSSGSTIINYLLYNILMLLITNIISIVFAFVISK